jgi:hypothetical protein
MTEEANTTAAQERDPIARLTLDYVDVLNGSRDHLPTLDDLGVELRRRVFEAWGRIEGLFEEGS